MGMTNLKTQKCKPCEGGVAPLSLAEAKEGIKQLPGWTLSSDGKEISREFLMRDFMSGVRFVLQIAEVAETEDHHPDFHLTGYRRLRIILSTHSIGGLSQNDFILAAKIEDLPKELKS